MLLTRYVHLARHIYASTALDGQGLPLPTGVLLQTVIKVPVLPYFYLDACTFRRRVRLDPQN
jgi:hypothetical protein